MSWLNDLSHDLAAALKSETRGEVIRWAGRPDPSAAFRSTLGILLFAVPWLAISLPISGAMLGAILKGPPATRVVSMFEVAMVWFGFVFSLSFVLIGLGMVAAPFLALRRARRTVFAITDDRILTISANKTRKVTTILPEKILKIERTERGNGSGTLKVVIGHKKDSDGDTIETAESLVGVPRVADAERWVNALIREGRRAA